MVQRDRDPPRSASDDWRRYDRHDPSEWLDHVLTRIVLGTSMEESGLVRTEEDRRRWLALERGVRELLDRGIAFVYDDPD